MADHNDRDNIYIQMKYDSTFSSVDIIMFHFTVRKLKRTKEDHGENPSADIGMIGRYHLRMETQSWGNWINVKLERDTSTRHLNRIPGVRETDYNQETDWRPRNTSVVTKVEIELRSNNKNQQLNSKLSMRRKTQRSKSKLGLIAFIFGHQPLEKPSQSRIVNKKFATIFPSWSLHFQRWTPYPLKGHFYENDE